MLSHKGGPSIRLSKARNFVFSVVAALRRRTRQLPIVLEMYLAVVVGFPVTVCFGCEESSDANAEITEPIPTPSADLAPVQIGSWEIGFPATNLLSRRERKLVHAVKEPFRISSGSFSLPFSWVAPTVKKHSPVDNLCGRGSSRRPGEASPVRLILRGDVSFAGRKAYEKL
ncbi:uncharacterized protein BT62DRAFT_1003625 [Guyanagaster necrorhizus]|uniref:Uncharacterized protein n=1 Tax=Guyanagaster necrorhizus TaxID=856835 RepID=A0A9P7VY58_9AGAR|nr:uncharacterized protein BT62DRAFT_1003625 [Guyanagaster necrorhizus MCA 3950]KAG7448900.1 hypothetical protein BT62DRAFT_1003625 [Guyanagaster necrorhizus MCA 3950]